MCAFDGAVSTTFTPTTSNPCQEGSQLCFSTSGSTGTSGTSSGTSGSLGSGVSCGENVQHLGSDDPTAVCYSFCASADPSSDVSTELVQTSLGSGSFVAHVVQHTPTQIDEMVEPISAGWSGDFFNFDGTTTDGVYIFHELGGYGFASDPANVELYPADGGTFGQGPIYINTLDCVMLYN